VKKDSRLQTSERFRREAPYHPMHPRARFAPQLATARMRAHRMKGSERLEDFFSRGRLQDAILFW
jgi:hypothetical protein